MSTPGLRWRLSRRHPVCWLLALLLLPWLAQAQSRVVLKLSLHDTVQPISAEFLARGLQQAAADHDALVLISLDTPGGLLDSTRAIVSSIERSPVPVCVYVSPTGARAGSAGLFLLEAADVAAMAPGTNAGASHPIVEGRTPDPVLKQKIENDAAAFLRSITVPRGRNAEAAEQAVRNSVSLSDAEALKEHLIDLVEPNDAALLGALDGRTLRRFDGRVDTLALHGYTLQHFTPSVRERFLAHLTDPDLAVLLLLAGILLVYLEFNVPGTIIPGALGTLCILLAFFGLHLLPVRGASVALLVVGLGLIVAEFKIPSHGIVAGVGILALLFALFTLVDAPIQELRVHFATAFAAALAFGLITLYLGNIALRARRGKRLLGPEAMVGLHGIVRSPVAPAGQHPLGQVELRGELWQAVLPAGASPLAPGTEVLVEEAHGFQLLVSPRRVH